MTNASVARIFLSSTFRDFGEERELLTKRVFPALRARLRERFVEIVDVDLRWGITPEAAERGEVLPICLAEIDRSRPWFIGMLGERYGWVPPSEKYDPTLVEQRPWLAEHQGGKSVTELEILHGVLNDPKMAGRAFFYFRTASYARKKGGNYVSISSEDETKLADLKDRIRTSGFPVMENYPNPGALAKRLEADLWEVLNEAYPQADVPDAFTREQHRHEAYALARRRLYLGGERYLAALDEALASGQQRILIGGQSGGGKSALVANWLERRRHAYPAEQIHEYYLGASADAASPVSLVRHLIERIKRTIGSQDETPADPEALLDSLPKWLADASAQGCKEDYCWIITLDGLNGLSDLRDLRWLPEFLPERVHLLVSCLPGEVLESLATKGTWQAVSVLPLMPLEQRQLLQTYLGHYNKTLEAAYEARVVNHPLAANPLFMRTLAEELRLFGRHEDLSDELDRYLSSLTVDDLFERVLERVEQDCGTKRVMAALTAIWASRAGLAEEELLAYARLVPATWAPIRLALDEVLLESGGRLTFAHDYMRIAVSDRYLAGNNELGDENQSPQALALRRKAHENLARWFKAHAFAADAASEGITINAARAAEEIPYQWRSAKNWRQLKKSLTERELFEAILEHNSSDELLELWLAIEVHTSARLEGQYQLAWKLWAPDDTDLGTGKLANSLAEFLREAGRVRHQLVRQLAEQALAITKKAHGPEHPDTGTRFNNLAYLLQAMGDYDAAEPFYRRALAIAEKAKGPEHPETGNIVSNLANLLLDKGDYARAELLCRRALAIAEHAKGPNHPETGVALSNLARLHYHNMDYVAAEPFYRHALAIHENAKGDNHPSTGSALSNLAMVLQAMGDYDAAEPIYRRALAIAEKAQGPEHPSTGVLLNNLATLLKAMGDYDAAEPIYRRALAIAEKAQGPEHPDTGGRVHNLAKLLQALGDYVGSEPLYRRALAIAEKAEGPEHPDTGVLLNNLATLLQAMGDHAGSEPLYRRALAIAEKAQGPEHLDTGKALNNLATLLEVMGDYAGSAPLYRRALEIAERVHGPEHSDTGNILNNLAGLLPALGDYAGSEPLYRRALAIAERTQGPEHPETRKRLNKLAMLLEVMGDYAGAEPLYRRALAIAEKAEGPEHPEVGDILFRLGSVLVKLKYDEEAEILLRREIAIVRKNEGDGSLSLAGSYHHLGVYLGNTGRLVEAEIELQNALTIREVEGSHSDDFVNTLTNLGNVHALRGEKSKALEFYNRSLEVLKAQDEPNEADITRLMARAADLDAN